MRANVQGMALVACVLLGCGGRARTDPDRSEFGPGAGGTGGATSPLWGCLDGSKPAAESGPVNVSLRVQNMVDSRPIAGAETTLCRKLDEFCSPTYSPTVLTDVHGNATLQVPRAYAGYVRVVKHDTTLVPKQQFVPSYYYFNPGVGSDVNVSITMTTVTARNQLNGFMGLPQLDDRGLILVQTSNCRSEAAAGISIRADSADEATTTFYVVGGLPDTSVNSTGSDGFGGFANIMAGTAMITGEILETGREIGTISLHVRPNAITQTRLLPAGS